MSTKTIGELVSELEAKRVEAAKAKEESKKALRNAGFGCFGAILGLASPFYSAYFALCYWEWFLTPALPAVSYWTLFGARLFLGVYLGYLAGSSNASDKEDDEVGARAGKRILLREAALLLAFGLAALTHFWIQT